MRGNRVQDVEDGLSEFPHVILNQARHIGKVVLSIGEPHYWVDQPSQGLFRPDATYLVVGGLGGFGLALAQWMTRRGARNLVLTSRSGIPRPDDEPALRALRESPAQVTTVSADAADRDAMSALLDRIRVTLPPLRGVVHAAMTLDDDLLGRLDHDRFQAVLAPKIAGSWNLHQLTPDDDLDVFVLFSSASSMIGVPAQGSYAAANAFLGWLPSRSRSARMAARPLRSRSVSRRRGFPRAR